MSKRKIAVIDDNPDFCLLCKQAIQLSGRQSEIFSSAHSALESFRSNTDLPALVFTDLSMPEMSGEDFVAQLRADSKFKEVKVILTSGWDNLEKRAQLAGADGCLRKPFDLERFFQTMDHYDSELK